VDECCGWFPLLEPIKFSEGVEIVMVCMDFTYRGFEGGLTIVQVDRNYKMFQDGKDKSCKS
jgi:hypothetical protein